MMEIFCFRKMNLVVQWMQCTDTSTFNYNYTRGLEPLIQSNQNHKAIMKIKSHTLLYSFPFFLNATFK